MGTERSRDNQSQSIVGVHWANIRSDLVSEQEQIKNDVFAKVVGQLIIRRKQIGLSQEELSKRVGIAQPNLARIETGNAIPKLDTFYKLTLALGLEIMLIPTDLTVAPFEQAAATTLQT